MFVFHAQLGNRTMWSGRCAAVSVVTELMDVHATLSIGIVSGDVPCDGGWGVLLGLLESDGAGDLGVTADGSNCNGGENPG